jgi:hypothetical protein
MSGSRKLTLIVDHSAWQPGGHGTKEGAGPRCLVQTHPGDHAPHSSPGIQSGYTYLPYLVILGRCLPMIQLESLGKSQVPVVVPASGRHSWPSPIRRFPPGLWIRKDLFRIRLRIRQLRKFRLRLRIRSCFGFGNAGLRLERVARQTSTLFVKLRRYVKFLEYKLT